MKNLLIAMLIAALGAGDAIAQESPYTGAVPEKGGVYYLYNVTTQQWVNAKADSYGYYGHQLGLDDEGMLIRLVDPKENAEIAFGFQCLGINWAGEKKINQWNYAPDYKNHWGWLAAVPTVGAEGYNTDHCADFYGGTYYADMTAESAEPVYYTKDESMNGKNAYKLNISVDGNKYLVAPTTEGHKTITVDAAGTDIWQFVTYAERYGSYSPYTGAEIENNGTYYLYNVASGKWFTTSGGRNGSAGSVSETANKIQLETLNDGYAIKTLEVGDDTYYGWLDEGKDYFVNSTAKERFNFVHLGNGLYMITLNYNEARHLAYTTGDHPITANYNAGDDIWQLITPEEYNDRYAKSGLTFPAEAQGYATICLPYQCKIPAGVTAYTAGEPESSTVPLVAVAGNVLPANEPVLLKGTAGENYKFVADDGAAIANFTNSFKGTLTATATSELGKVLTLGRNSEDNTQVGFYVFSGETIPANKAYYPVPAGSEVRAISFDFDSEATGIQSLHTDNASEQWFDLQGRSVAQPIQRGIYIKNGKKIIVK